MYIFISNSKNLNRKHAKLLNIKINIFRTWAGLSKRPEWKILIKIWLLIVKKKKVETLRFPIANSHFITAFELYKRNDLHTTIVAGTLSLLFFLDLNRLNLFLTFVVWVSGNEVRGRFGAGGGVVIVSLSLFLISYTQFISALTYCIRFYKKYESTSAPID